MRELNRPAQIYILLIFGLGLAAVLASLYAIVIEPAASLIVVALTIIIALLDRYPVLLNTNKANSGVEITISVAVKMAITLLLPPPIVVLSVFGGTVLGETLLRRPWYKLIFNVGMMTIIWTVVPELYDLVHDPNAPLLGSAQNLLALVALGVSDVVMNGVLVSLVIALVTRIPVTYAWAQNYKPLVVHDLSMLPIGLFIYILWQYTPWSVLLAALPLFVMRHSYQLVSDLGRQTREALYALARMLDERDEYTSRHSELVAENASLIAREMGLGPEQVEVITLAAAMHDIGKIGMRNDILFKPDTLTHEERHKAERHAAIGGELLEKFPLFEEGAIYVRHHHERWDGKGYPDGLSGENIPLGARILAVADSYQAMVEQRPYRAPLSPAAALEQLREGAGTQFDPHVVSAFLSAKQVTLAEIPNPAAFPPQNQISVSETI